jgi:hypothetical protein
MMVYQARRGRKATSKDLFGRTKLTSEIEIVTASTQVEIVQKFKVGSALPCSSAHFTVILHLGSTGKSVNNIRCMDE